MVCCATVLLVFGFLRRLWPGARRRAASQPDFAPQAHRPAPGTEPIPAIWMRSAMRPQPQPADRARLIARSAAAGAIGYLLASTVLLLIGTAHSTASATSWALRTAVIVASVAVVLTRLERQPAGVRERTGCGLAGFGIAWIQLGEIDVHLLDLFDLSGTFGHVVFHGAGVVALITGALVLVRTPIVSLKEDHDVRDRRVDRHHADRDRVDTGGPGDPALPAGSGLAAAGRL